MKRTTVSKRINPKDEYVGKDSLFDFGKAASFVSERETGNTFAFELANATTDNHVVALSPAYFADVTALQKRFSSATAILADGDLAVDGGDPTKKLVATPLDSSNKINDFVAFAKNAPLRAWGIFFESTDKKFFSGVLESHEVNPFVNKPNAKIHLRRWVNQKDYQTDRASKDLLLQNEVLHFAHDEVILLPVPAGVTVTIQLEIGAIMSTSMLLRKHSALARRNIVRKGLK